MRPHCPGDHQPQDGESPAEVAVNPQEGCGEMGVKEKYVILCDFQHTPAVLISLIGLLDFKMRLQLWIHITRLLQHLPIKAECILCVLKPFKCGVGLFPTGQPLIICRYLV